MTDKKETTNKTAKLFKALAQKAFDFRTGSIVADSSFDEMIAFTRLHNHFLEMKFVSEKTKGILRDRYPFLKVGGRWRVSIPILYLYLVAARHPIGTFENSDMVDVYVMTQHSMR